MVRGCRQLDGQEGHRAPRISVPLLLLLLVAVFPVCLLLLTPGLICIAAHSYVARLADCLPVCAVVGFGKKRGPNSQ